MMDLARRHADRIARKVEDALTGGQPLELSRAGIGEVHPRHPDAAVVNEQTEAAIARAASIIGAAPVRFPASGFTVPFQHKVKLTGV